MTTVEADFWRGSGTLYNSVPGLSGGPDVPHAVHVSKGVSLEAEGNGVGTLTEPPVNGKNASSNSFVVTSSSQQRQRHVIARSPQLTQHYHRTDSLSSGGTSSFDEDSCDFPDLYGGGGIPIDRGGFPIDRGGGDTGGRCLISHSHLTKSSVLVNDASLSLAQAPSNLCFRIQLADGVLVSWETVLRGTKLFVEVPNGILPEGSKESFVTLLEYAEEKLNCSHVYVCFRVERADRNSLVRTFMFLGFLTVPPGDPALPLTGNIMFMVYPIDRDDDSSDEDEPGSAINTVKG